MRDRERARERDMEKKQGQYVEWAQLRMEGIPLMAGLSVGPSSLLWVACRTSPNLVQVFEDGQLLSVWQFPTDPVYVHLGSFLSRKREESGSLVEGSLRKEHGASLLVITIDGSVWLLESNQQRPSFSRPAKKQRESGHDEMKKAARNSENSKQKDVLEPSSSASKHSNLQPNKDEWSLFDDIDMYDSQELFGFEEVFEPKKMPSSLTRKHAETMQNVSSVDVPALPTSYNVQPLTILWRHFKISSSEEKPQKSKLQLVPPTMRLGVVPDACLACFGPNGSVIVLTLLGSLTLFQTGSGSHGASSFAATQPHNPLGDHVLSTGECRQTCVLFASAVSETGAASVPLQLRFFESLFKYCGSQQPKNAMFTGDTAGKLHAIPIDSFGAAMCTPTLVCELKEPIIAVLAVSSVATTIEHSRPRDSRCVKTMTDASPLLKNDRLFDARMEQEPREHDHLLIIGKHGHMMAIYPKNIREQSFHSLFLSADSLEEHYCANHRTSSRSHLEGLVVRDWRIKFPVVEACIVGPGKLCYCAGSRIFIMDLFENIDSSFYSRGTYAGRAGIFTGVNHYKKNLQRPLCSIFLSREVPLSETVVQLSSKVCLAGSMNGRPVVALTSRGKLLSVEVSEHSLLTGEVVSLSSADVQKSLNTSFRKTKARLKELIQKIAEATRSFDAVQHSVCALNSAIHELATALHVAYHLSSSSCNNPLQKPGIFPDGCAIPHNAPSQTPSGRLWCSLRVSPESRIFLSVEQLQFAPDNHRDRLIFPAMSCDHSTSSIRLSVDLYNHSSFPLSPYWTMVLNVSSLVSKCNPAAYFSTIINSGLGLPTGGCCTSDFDLMAPCQNWEPLLVSIYLCHIHDFHKILLESSGSDDNTSGSCFYVSSCCDKIPVDKPLNSEDELHLWNRVSPKGHAGSPDLCEGHEELLETPGAVCFLLSQYRIDILSFLMPPHPGLGYKPHEGDKTLQSRNGSTRYAHEEHLFGSFSGSIVLPARPGQMNAKVTELWALFNLEDLVQRSNMKVGNLLVMLTPGGERVSFSLEKDVPEDGVNAVWRLKFQASSLLIGCVVREAILSRLEEHENNFEGSGNFHSLDQERKIVCHSMEKVIQSDHCAAYGRLGEIDGESLIAAMKIIHNIGDRAEVLLRQWEDVRACAQAEGTDVVSNLLNNTYLLVQELLQAYKSLCNLSPLR